MTAAPAFAQDRSIWALVVNDELKGDIEIVLTADGPWVDPSALVAAGVSACQTAVGKRSRRTPPRAYCSPRSRRKSRSPSTKRRFA